LLLAWKGLRGDVTSSILHSARGGWLAFRSRSRVVSLSLSLYRWLKLSYFSALNFKAFGALRENRFVHLVAIFPFAFVFCMKKAATDANGILANVFSSPLSSGLVRWEETHRATRLILDETFR
jgi:hypothetical protein